MGHDYYGSSRKEILALVPQTAERILDVGCGTGNTAVWLKEIRSSSWVAGVELCKPAAAEARLKLDAVFEGSIEELELPIEKSSLDLILCLDVLEHLVDPWRTLARLHQFLKPTGVLIASLPNVRNRRVILPLVFKGEWNYSEWGILDRQHLRFFSRKTAIELLQSAGLAVDMIAVTGGFTRGRMGCILKKLLPDSIQSFFVRQYILRGINPAP